MGLYTPEARKECVKKKQREYWDKIKRASQKTGRTAYKYTKKGYNKSSRLIKDKYIENQGRYYCKKCKRYHNKKRGRKKNKIYNYHLQFRK